MKRQPASLERCIGASLTMICRPRWIDSYSADEFILCFDNGKYVKFESDTDIIVGEEIDNLEPYSDRDKLDAGLMTQEEIDERDRLLVEAQVNANRQQFKKDLETIQSLVKKHGLNPIEIPEHLL